MNGQYLNGRLLRAALNIRKSLIEDDYIPLDKSFNIFPGAINAFRHLRNKSEIILIVSEQCDSVTLQKNGKIIKRVY